MWNTSIRCAGFSAIALVCFIHIISQLAHDEAVILSELMNRESVRFIRPTNDPGSYILDITKGGLLFPNNSFLYATHLNSLNLVEVARNLVFVSYDNRHICLSEFGKLFVKACIPVGGFRNQQG